MHQTQKIALSAGADIKTLAQLETCKQAMAVTGYNPPALEEGQAVNAEGKVVNVKAEELTKLVELVKLFYLILHIAFLPLLFAYC